MGRFRLFLVLALALILVPAPSRAQSWATNGVRLSPASLYRNYTTAVADGSGGVYVAWSDLQQSGNHDVYVQHYDANGDRVAGWPEHGLVVCDEPEAQYPPSLLPDGSGGVYVAWEDYRANGLDPELYLTRVSANGTYASGWQQDGSPVESGTGRWTREIAMAQDGSGGLVLAYTAHSTGEFYTGIRYQRFTGTRTLPSGWAANGAWLTSNYFCSSPKLVSDGAGRFVVGYSAIEPLAVKVWAKRVRLDGTLDPSWHYAPNYNGAAVNPGTTSDMHSFSLATISPGHVAFTWLDEWRGSGDSDVQLSVLDSTGIQPASGSWWHTLDVASATGDCGAPQIVADGSGGLMIAWRDLRFVGSGGQPRLYAKHFASDGSSTWSSSGNSMVGWYVSGDPQLLRMSDGTYRASFTSSAGGGAEVYATQFTQAATISAGWTSTTGNSVCTMDEQQVAVALVPSTGTDAIVVWNDDRQLSGVYGARLQTNGTVPALASLRTIEAFAGRVEVEWLVAGERAVSVERSADGVAWDALGEAVEESPGAFRFVDTQVTPGARYAYRPVFASGGHGEAAWVHVPTTLAFGLRVASAQPGRGMVTLECALPGAAPARLRVHDVSGRLVASHALAGGGVRRVAWSAANRAPGVYLVTLEQSGVSRRAKLTLLD